jgi:tight adherence protein B
VLLGFMALSACYGTLLVIRGGGRRSLARRARKMRPGARGQSLPTAVASIDLRRDMHGGLDIFARRVLPRSAALGERLAETGLDIPIGRYGLICLILALAIAALLFLRRVPALAALPLGIVAGLWLPYLATGWLVKRRRKKFTKLFPETIGLMVRGLKAGLTITDMMAIVGREIADPVGEEFRTMGDQIRLGQRVEDAMWAVARRLELPEFNFLVISLSVQRETGGNLAETLENLQGLLLRRENMRLKIKAMSSEAVATASIIGILPFVIMIMLYVVSPTYIMTLFTTPLGLKLAGGAAFSLSLGVFVMVRMIRFDI